MRQPTIANDNAKESLSIGITQGPDQLQQLRNQNWNMPFLQIVITLVLVGLLLWLVNRFIPMQSTTMKSILNGFAVIVAVLWLLTLFGGFTPSLVRTLEAERNSEQFIHAECAHSRVQSWSSQDVGPAEQWNHPEAAVRE